MRDEILAHVNDPALPFHRFDIVGDAGLGKSVLLQEVAKRCTDSGLLVLDIAAHHETYPAGDSAQDQELADLYACSDLIADLVISIDAFRTGNPGSQAATSRAIDALLRARSLNRLHHLVVNANTSADPDIADGTVPAGQEQELLATLLTATELALLRLAEEYPLAILVDDVHLLARVSVQDWLQKLLRSVPARCNVTTRRLESDSWRQGLTGDDQTIRLQNMTPEEVREYLRDRRLAFDEDEARDLFDWSRGHGLSVVVWCDLKLDAGAGRSTDLAGSAGFTSLVELVESAVDQIAVDITGYPLPLFALLTIADAVTPKLIAMLEGDTGQSPSELESKKIYRRLAAKRFIPAVDDRNVEEGVYLYRAIREEAGQRLREDDPVLFQDMHSCAERYHRAEVDLEAEIKQESPFSAWLRFEDPVWLRSVERWLEHATWLDRQRFMAMKPALAKIYLDAFWWWDDYLRSAATSILAPALRKVAVQQRDMPWMNALKEFSDHWVSSWDEDVLRANPGEWRLVLDAITALFNIFGLQRGRVPAPLELRRIYILLCQFYGKALWCAGKAEADHVGEVDTEHAERANEWLMAAAAACATQPEEKDEDNPNGWIADWALLRQAEVWSAWDPQRSTWYLDGLDRRAIDGEDYDLRVGIGMLIGDLRWRSGEFAAALDAYALTLFISCIYNVKQSWRRKAPNLYTKSLYASVIVRTEERIAELEQAGEIELIDAALGNMRELFNPYWERFHSRPGSRPELARFALPVPPPPDDAEISALERENEVYALEKEYVRALEDLATSRENFINRPIVLPLVDRIQVKRRAGMHTLEVNESGPVIEAFYHQILEPSFSADVLIGLDELQDIAASDVGSVWLATDDDGTILGGAVGEWDESARVVLLGYLAVRPGIRGGGIGGPLYLDALDSWRQKFRPCLVLAEIEDPDVPGHSDNEEHGDAAARLRFYLSRGSRVLDIPYFQPALEPGADRVSGLLLIVLHADQDFAGAEEGTIDAGPVRKYLENYQIQYEGKVATDDQAMEMWRALDRPGGVRLRDS